MDLLTIQVKTEMFCLKSKRATRIIDRQTVSSIEQFSLDGCHRENPRTRKMVAGISFKVSSHFEIFIFPILEENTQENRHLSNFGLKDALEMGT